MIVCLHTLEEVGYLAKATIQDKSMLPTFVLMICVQD